MPPWGHVFLLGLGGCWGFLQTAAAATISMGWRCWSFIDRSRWFNQSAGSGRSPKIQVYPCHCHPTPWINTKQFLLGEILACLGPQHQVSSCRVVSLNKSCGFSSIFTNRFLIFWVRTLNPSGATGDQTQQDRISPFFWQSESGQRASRAAPLGRLCWDPWRSRRGACPHT